MSRKKSIPEVRVLIVDDHPVVREGIRAMLGTDPRIEIVGEAADGVEAIQKAADLDPQVILMDISMPKLDGIEATHQIKQSHPEISVIVMTIYERDAFVVRALRAGAARYLLKETSREMLLHTIHLAKSGGTLMDSSLLRTVLGGGRRQKSPGPDRKPAAVSTTNAPAAAAAKSRPLLPQPGLTDRELQVLGLLCRGQSNREIGQQLSITELTAKKHVSSIVDKLGVHNRSSAAIMAVQNNWV